MTGVIPFDQLTEQQKDAYWIQSKATAGQADPRYIAGDPAADFMWPSAWTRPATTALLVANGTREIGCLRKLVNGLEPAAIPSSLSRALQNSTPHLIADRGNAN